MCWHMLTFGGDESTDTCLTSSRTCTQITDSHLRKKIFESCANTWYPSSLLEPGKGMRKLKTPKPESN